MKNEETEGLVSDKLSLNLAIVGGGNTCKTLLENLRNDAFDYLEINILGVCDLDPEAEGFLLAKKMGIYVTDKFQELCNIEGLHAVIELTGSEEVLLEIIRIRPGGVGVLEYHVGMLLKDLFLGKQRLRSVEHRLLLEKMGADFLIHQANERIAIVNPDFKLIEVNEAYLKAAAMR